MDANELTAAARDVLAERKRQIEAEGWTAEHDDRHTKGELCAAGACYAMPPGTWHASDIRKWLWPWSPKWLKLSTDHRRNLVKAGALILAEIERLDRREGATPKATAKAPDHG